jgi:hypothetical protein
MVLAEGAAGDGSGGDGLGGVDHGIEHVRRVAAEEGQRHFLVLGVDGGEQAEPAAGFCQVLPAGEAGSGQDGSQGMSSP